jgi:hypothetical protein
MNAGAVTVPHPATKRQLAGLLDLGGAAARASAAPPTSSHVRLYTPLR